MKETGFFWLVSSVYSPQLFRKQPPTEEKHLARAGLHLLRAIVQHEAGAKAWSRLSALVKGLHILGKGAQIALTTVHHVSAFVIFHLQILT